MPIAAETATDTTIAGTEIAVGQWSELRTINDRVVKLIDEYSNSFPKLTDDRAAALIGDYLTAEADRAQLRRTYLPEFSKALSGRKVARFYQLENKMEAVLRYDLAAHIPVVEP